MSDSNVTPLPTPERDSNIAYIEAQIRKIEIMAGLSDRLAEAHHRLYQSYMKAGFDSYDAREMTMSYRPSFF